jgi:hypothetical protein
MPTVTDYPANNGIGRRVSIRRDDDDFVVAVRYYCPRIYRPIVKRAFALRLTADLNPTRWTASPAAFHGFDAHDRGIDGFLWNGRYNGSESIDPIGDEIGELNVRDSSLPLL